MLLLFPAAFLVVVVLGAITVDVALVQARARELQAVADSAASDALAALDVDTLRADGVVALDPARVRAIAETTVTAGPLPGATVVEVALGADPLGRPEVAITVRFTVELVMAPAIPSGPRSTTLTRTGRAVILEG